ncbi:uncharacterized protein LOC120166916 [Hibiscus syriacus]|uniref:uncharacterized protein LOC120166916 n=1 Tax=Hibiscus syriacus TaxID=106335 RepID=UPI001922852E|nr:uncharacterized protein LOC120166916 [Hibiscus syriacus]
MKEPKKDSDKLVWDQIQMRRPSGNNLVHGSSSSTPIPKLMIFNKSQQYGGDDGVAPPTLGCPGETNGFITNAQGSAETDGDSRRRVRDRGFFQAMAAEERVHQGLVQAGTMRGVVWLDNRVKYSAEDGRALPPVQFSSDTSKFAYANKQGHRSAIRISRIVTETLRMKMDNVRWFVMGDDDTVFITDNLIRILRKYDHTQYYYIGSLSESHIQNNFLSYSMAYGGGFAISYHWLRPCQKCKSSIFKGSQGYTAPMIGNKLAWLNSVSHSPMNAVSTR